MAVLLDTCAVIWISQDEPISLAAQEKLEEARRANEPVFVSPITAWELGLLVARGRLNLQMSSIRWFDVLMQAPGVELADMPPDLMIASSFLPGTPPRDPADRILAATAREYGYQLMTRDNTLLAYGEQGHIQCLQC
jgi:PIN domain nuclease of toxin-antitoxin system